MLGCTKADLSRWEKNPCSTHLTSRNAKKAAALKAGELFHLTSEECEALVNKAGLSFGGGNYGLEELFGGGGCPGRRAGLLRNAGVSERMFQYYLSGRIPTKQALLALAVAMELPPGQIKELLRRYGYCLSGSLPNDAVVLWFFNYAQGKKGASLLNEMNLVLDDLELPLLMTKLIDR